MNIYEAIKSNLKESNDKIYTIDDVWVDGYSDENIAKIEKDCDVKIQKIGTPNKHTNEQKLKITGTKENIIRSRYDGYTPSDNDKEYNERLFKESGSQTTSLDYVKELAGYLQDFIDGCEKRNMTELSLPYSHLAGDALAVAGDRGGWITLTSDFSYDDDEIFDEYKPDGWTSEESNEEEIEDSETIKEDDTDNFGSEQNTDAYENIKSLIKYFNQYIEVVKKNSFHYQGEDPDKLYKILTKLYEVQDAMDEAWPVDGE